MEWFRQWLLGITAAAMLNALAGSLMPKGIVRKIGKLTGGLVLLLAILQPIYRLDENTVTEVFSPYIGEIEAYSESIPATETISFMKNIIETECSAYIQDKAKEMGIDCRVTVVCGEEETGYPYPEAVLVDGIQSEEQKKQLEKLIETDLAVPKQSQTYLLKVVK